MIVIAEIASLGDMLERPLTLPPYQRPYRWKTPLVAQLIDDLLAHRHKPAYRLGTVVLHKSNDLSEIVDGQQRLLTLTMLRQALEPAAVSRMPLLAHSFKSRISIFYLHQNAIFIRQRLARLGQADRQSLADFLAQRCEIACITLDDLNEAFQFFDSQNARGKDLYPHDLLKAFHLRQMTRETQEAAFAVVGRWEQQVRLDAANRGRHGLRAVLGEVLFALRRWTAGEHGMKFTRADLAAFKGLDLADCRYPSAAALRLADRQGEAYPFQVGQTMINGRHFFDYVQHYLDMYTELFVHPNPALARVLATLDSYKGRHRTGDGYVRSLFTAAVLLYRDKFGSEGLQEAAELAFVWSYRLRLTLLRVGRESVDNDGCAAVGFIRTIHRAVHHQEVFAFIVAPLSETEVAASDVEGITKLFAELGYLHAE
jgi:hypothetical protein